MSIFSKIFRSNEDVVKEPIRTSETADQISASAFDKNQPGSMMVDDVFSITGRGTVATGRIDSGYFYIGQKAVVVTDAGEIPTEITGIEVFRKTLDHAGPGEMVGILVKDIKRNEINRGDTIRGIAE